MDLKDLTAEALDCRSMGHSWFHRDDQEHTFRKSHGISTLVSFVRFEECGRCGAERRRTINLERGEVTRRSTRYPDGYLLKNHPRVSRFDALRATYTTR